MNDHVSEASRLINRCLDEVVIPAEEERLAVLMSAHPELLDLYVGLSQIHGHMVWGGIATAVPSHSVTESHVALPHTKPAAGLRSFRWNVPVMFALCLVVLITVGWYVVTLPRLADAPVASEQPVPVDAGMTSGLDATDAEVIAAIDDGIAAVLSENAIEFSPLATDEEWVRRAYLTLAGRIPTPEESRAFLERPADSRREELVSRLTADDDRNRHLAEFWTNLLIGRSQRPHVNRAALTQFLEESFAANRSWISVADELLSAEGRNKENGATIFPLEHLDSHATFLREDSRQQAARAIVNRTWAQFFGYGFTNPVDDMGPHVPISHPDVLDTLADAFVASNYDLRRLQTWIALSDPWQRTSQATEFNQSDDPEAGSRPLFSRVYLRRMSPEQIYDSIRIAVQATSSGGMPYERTSHRREWVSQFVYAYNTDEDDEATQVDASINQAMVLMNGSDVNQAIAGASRALLNNTAAQSSAGVALERITQAALTRRPTARESAVFRHRLKQLSREMPVQEALTTVVEDMLWACLNSSEFAVIH